VLSLSLTFFIIFLLQKPREIEVLNEYVDRKVAEMYPQWDYRRGSGKIGLSGLKLTYHLDNFKVKFNSNFLFLPSTIFKIEIRSLLRRKFKIDELIVENLDSYIYLNSTLPPKINGNDSLGDQPISGLFYSIIEYLHTKEIAIKSLVFRNSIARIYDANENISNKFELDDIVLSFKKKNNRSTTSINIYARINNGNKYNPAKIAGGCHIYQNREISCNIDADNFLPSNIHLQNILGDDSHYGNILDGIHGLFNVRLSLNFTDYIILKNSDFTIFSSAGSFDLGGFLSKKITYRNFSLEGETLGTNYINLKNLRATFLLGKNIDFFMTLQAESRKTMEIDVNIMNASTGDLKVLWPVFLNDFALRDWIIEHLESGHIPKAKARMKFDYLDRGFELTKIDSKVIFRNARLNYHSNFPSFYNMDALAVFTMDGMSIEVDRASMANNTQVKAALIELDFNDDKSMLNISAKTFGKIYEAMYFIDNGARKKIKEITLNYLNGPASLDINVKIPLANDSIALKDVFIEIGGEVIKNDTFFLATDSNLKLHVLKDFLSETFRTKLDLEDSIINWATIDFIKKRGEQLDLSLEIVDSDSGILLNNILASGAGLNFFGEGLLAGEKLSGLQLKNVNYGKNSFSINYVIDENFGANLELGGDSININLNIAEKASGDYIKQYLMENMSSNADSPMNNIKYNVFLKNVLINGEYNLENLALEGLVKDGLIRYIKAKTQKNGGSTAFFDLTQIDRAGDDIKYSIAASCSNFGQFLSELNMTDTLIHGDLHIDAAIASNGVIAGEIGLRDGFSYIIGKSNQRDTKFFNYIMNSKDVPDNLKNILKHQSTLSFNKLEAKFKLTNSILAIDDFLLSTNDVLGIGLSGAGDMDVKNGKIKFSGLMVPLEKINTMFGLDKVPIIGNFLFGGKGGGLMAIGYRFTKDSSDSDYNFKIIPSTLINPISLKNFLLIFLLL
jgi:hypothetical protein